MSEINDRLAYEKILILHEQCYSDMPAYTRAFQMLFQCMKDSNKLNDHECEWFQLRVRPTRFDERPPGIAFEMRWGDKKLLSNNVAIQESSHTQDSSSDSVETSSTLEADKCLPDKNHGKSVFCKKNKGRSSGKRPVG